MIRLALALFLSLGAVAQADEAAPPLPEPAAPVGAPAEQKSAQKNVNGWGRDNPDCAEWSDACVVCTREACSTPGIACTPKETACRRK